MFERVRSGVVRIQSVSCEGSAAGTGFFVGPNLVATMAHVVEDASGLSVRGDRGVVRGTVIGSQADREVALVQLQPTGDGERLQGHVFSFSGTEPQVGNEVFALGYSEGGPLSMLPGSVTGLQSTIDIGGQSITGLFQHNADTAGGNSGGPLVDRTGRVVGLEEAGRVTWVRSADNSIVAVEKPGRKHAVKATIAAPLVQAWMAAPRPTAAPSCPARLEPLVKVTSRHPEADILAQTFYMYAANINVEDYADAWKLLGPGGRAEFGSFSTFSERMSSVVVSDVIVESALRRSVVEDTVVVSLTEVDTAVNSCTRYTREYAMALDTGSWRLESHQDKQAPRTCDESPPTGTPSRTSSSTPSR